MKNRTQPKKRRTTKPHDHHAHHTTFMGFIRELVQENRAMMKHIGENGPSGW